MLRSQRSHTSGRSHNPSYTLRRMSSLQKGLAFPAILNRLDLAAFDLATLVRPVLAAVPSLPPDAMRHLAFLEQRAIEVQVLPLFLPACAAMPELLSWMHDSGLRDQLSIFVLGPVALAQRVSFWRRLCRVRLLRALPQTSLMQS